MSLLLPLGTWVPILDGDPLAAAIYDQHYSSKRSRERRARNGTLQFGGPSARLILSTPCRKALFGWRRQQYRADEQTGVECFIFSNLGAGLSSVLVAAADAIADRRWPGERHFTFVDAAEIKSTNPGYCFLKAGWERCGTSQERGLVILSRAAPAALQEAA